MKIEITRRTPDEETIRNIYDICNKIFKDKDVFYKEKDLKIMVGNRKKYLDKKICLEAI